MRGDDYFIIFICLLGIAGLIVLFLGHSLGAW